MKVAISLFFILSICIQDLFAQRFFSEEKLWSQSVYSIEEALKNPRKTVSVYLRDTSLRSIPSGLQNLPKLQMLKISDSKIESFSSFDAPRLRFLDLSGSSEIDLASLLEENSFPLLEKLILNFCEIESIPGSILDLCNLVNLEFSNNRIAHLPEKIGSMRKLASLLLQNNNLRSLPFSFGNFEQLEMLVLTGNSFLELPQEITNIKTLKSLFVGNEGMDVYQMIGVLSKCESIEILHLSEIKIGSCANIGRLAELPNLERIILDDVFESEEDIHLAELGRFKGEVFINTSLELGDDTRLKIESYDNLILNRIE
ncbi:leucine-rich repeat domain-containing protein [Algoriphagus sp. H41]|uniref:Leucine-rich repeat domain-containing protein n=1 Tax=Algoriphagus oliviformis TaxID=2811231 RepID=A0ABS3C6T3_9BACT|nr:leucine-rich repeat domain-containing protein [Algoriphagus oliviformis]MBN7811846.1 leucine-rich repeat domain-containing protein [Algoriphagus oliviformis]